MPRPATASGGTVEDVVLRAARDGDVEAIARVWHGAWADGHLGHVPEAILAHRGLDDLRRRVPLRLGTTTVAVGRGEVVGFVVTHDDMVEQLYVAAPWRGGDVAGRLLRHGEEAIGARFPVAWLAVVAGNTRARRFYERHGWVDAGPYDNPAFTRDGSTILVPALRYEKRLA